MPVLSYVHFHPGTELPALARDRPVFGQDNFVYAFARAYDCVYPANATSFTDCAPLLVQAVQFSIDDGVWRSMKPFPGPSFADFYFRTRDYAATQGEIPPSLAIGMHQACVRAINTLGMVSPDSPEYQCVSFEVTP